MRPRVPRPTTLSWRRVLKTIKLLPELTHFCPVLSLQPTDTNQPFMSNAQSPHAQSPFNPIPTSLAEIPVELDRHFPFFLDIESDELYTTCHEHIGPITWESKNDLGSFTRPHNQLSVVQGPRVSPGFSCVSNNISNHTEHIRCQ